MFQDFDAGDEIIAAADTSVCVGVCEGIRERTGAAIWPHVGPHLADGIFGDVDSPRLDPSGPQGLDQETPGASRVENGAWFQGANDLAGDGAEELKPVGASFVGNSAAVVAVVILVIEATVVFLQVRLVYRIREA